MVSKWNWNTAKTAPGAGIIVVRRFNKTCRVLGLWARGGYDIPKGHIEDGDDIFETALRETKEEVNIDKLNFTWGHNPYREGNLFIYLAETSQEAKILINDKSGIYEHEYVKWLTWSEMIEKTYDYLKPALKHAQKTVEEKYDTTKNK
jgi:8-oxo-dGTP pyrophosphatase MutT (NUDIX family)